MKSQRYVVNFFKNKIDSFYEIDYSRNFFNC